MNVSWIKFKNHPCFKNEYSGFDDFKKFTVIVGRNNSGKSHLLDLVAALCEGTALKRRWDVQTGGRLVREKLEKNFTPNGWFSGITEPWINHGKHFVDCEVRVEFQGEAPTQIEFTADPGRLTVGATESEPKKSKIHEARKMALKDSVKEPKLPLYDRRFLRLAADRNIEPEPKHTDWGIYGSGKGATNAIRKFLQSAGFDRDVILKEVRNGLNQIFASDGHFTDIEVKDYDEANDHTRDNWEIFLAEEGKGLIPLSKSGSGLKTVILVLLYLHVLTRHRDYENKELVFAFEELENNLHPALLRRLLTYIEARARQLRAYIFFTTHSSVMLDYFLESPDAQLIHVTHDGKSACAKTISSYAGHRGIISELGAKPSDLLQSNGIVWVEGPSDRVYLNHWIGLVSNGELREGRDYVCAFYGGSMLARMQAKDPVEEARDLVNLIRINGNLALVCDSDRTAASGTGYDLKERVVRIREEVRKLNGHVWITDVKEIENYLPLAVLKILYPKMQDVEPGQYENFWPSETVANSFYKDKLNRSAVEKVNLALSAVNEMKRDSLKGRFDWETAMTELVKVIRTWNK